MSENDSGLKNSRRRFYTAAYTPVTTRGPGDEGRGDALGRAALLRALQINPSELGALREMPLSPNEQVALEAVAAVVLADSPDRALAAAAGLAEIPDADLISLAEHLAQVRGERIQSLVRRIEDLDSLRQQAQEQGPGDDQPAPPGGTSDGPAPGQGTTSDGPASASTRLGQSTDGPAGSLSVVRPESPARTALQTISSVDVGPASKEGQEMALVSAITPSLTSHALSPARVAGLNPMVADRLGLELAVRAPDLFDWAAEAEPAPYAQMLEEARPYLPIAAKDGRFNLAEVLPELERQRQLAERLPQVLTRRPLEPLGLLHLERLEMTPMAVERGELLYSLPLAPKEKVTLSHKEWTVHQEEFARYIQDYLENFSEQGVAEAEELAMSSETQAQHANSLSMSQTTAAGGAVTVTSPVDATNQVMNTVEAASSQQESKIKSRSVTARASARTIKDHKVSFTVTTVSGMEDFTARVLENTKEDRAMLIDYYRRVRRWRTDLYRYDVRLTYDVVLPDPGYRLRARYLEIKEIDAALAAGFNFSLRASQITPENFPIYAESHGIVLPPPPQKRKLVISEKIDYAPPQELTVRNVAGQPKMETRELALNIPDGFRIESLSASVDASAWRPDDPNLVLMWIIAGASRQLVVPNPQGFLQANVPFNASSFPEAGQVKAVFISAYVSTGVVKLTGTLAPTQAAIEGWRAQCWTRLREAAYNDYLQQRDQMREGRAALLREIEAADALSLRRMEREQIMYLVLQWLFPALDDTGALWTYLQSPSTAPPQAWQQVMEYGEYIKFVHAAIDWDNVMVSLVPYFWDAPARHREKLFFDHPDPVHREFLRAGAARVILAVRPGFEEEIASLLDQARLGSLPDGHRFHKVIQDVRAAQAAYREADAPAPDEGQAPGGNVDDPREPGVLIGSWTDFTPTGALDMEVTLNKVIEA